LFAISRECKIEEGKKEKEKNRFKNITIYGAGTLGTITRPPPTHTKITFWPTRAKTLG